MSKCRVCDAVLKSKTEAVIHTARTHTHHDTIAFRKSLNECLNGLITTPTTPQETLQNINQINNYLTATTPDTYAQLIKIKDNLEQLPKTEKYKVMIEEYEIVLYSYMDNIKPAIDELINTATATTNKL
eukprot:g44538.t1